MDADFFQACNCNFGCPCEFEAPPSMGFCEGMGAWRIRKGNYGKLKLDGLGLGFSAHWPAEIYKGNGTAVIFIDEKASASQREALLNIATGKDGGLPFEVIATTFSKVLDPQFVSFEFKIKGKNGSVRMGKNATMGFQPIKNPVSGEEESIRIKHATGFIFQEAESLASTICESKVGELAYSWPGKSAFVSRIKYKNT